MNARDAYLETQIATATPQKLRLMLIEAALRQARAAQAAFAADRSEEAWAAGGRCREIVAELIAGIRIEQSTAAKQALAIHLFVFSALTDAQHSRDGNQLAGVIRVLEEERRTWEEVCRRFPERPAGPPARSSTAAEEVAPQRVEPQWQPPYGSPPAPGAPGFALDA
jgi:flagellar protein FliS